ncbi:hypothetical protein V1387_13945 [Allomuricauda taeanensis]|uniref:hypothetical protein n=1 Tax=Flagellimonas taeanensis TaxID=1005926 RepID=UPI002E7C2844|nr:hypothetical protein [Allomuricauda taeanensis]MEE1963795.1 hypothetical protein [Allomuricauda taeanensis]
MKKINIFSLLALSCSAVIFTNCTEKEEFIGYPLKQENTIVNITGTITTPTPANAEGRDLDITVTISQSFSSDAEVEVVATLKNGVQSTTTVTVPAGDTSVDGTIALPTDGTDSGVEGISSFVSIELTAILLSELEPGINYTISSDPLTVDLYDAIQFDYDDGVVAGRMTYLVDWANPSINDLDVYVSTLEAAETGDRYETDIFDDTHPDGTYTIDVAVYIASESDIPWRIFFVYPDQTTFEIFEGVLTGVSGGEFFSLVTFTKSTDGEGVVTYSNVSAL